MKILKLSNSIKEVLIDDKHYERLSKYTWYICGQDERTIQRSEYEGGKIKRTKSITLANEIKQDYINIFDHKDRNPFNNQEDNLRPCTVSQNAANTSKRLGIFSSKYKGVNWNKKDKRWQAKIRVSNRYIHLGYFKIEHEAALAYNIAATKHFGEFAFLNIVEGISM